VSALYAEAAAYRTEANRLRAELKAHTGHHHNEGARP
jgi:hypothetical protein